MAGLREQLLHGECHSPLLHKTGMICAQWPARSQPTVVAVCILSLVPYIFGSTLRCETIGVLCDLFLLNLFSCRILPTCRRALVGLQLLQNEVQRSYHIIKSCHGSGVSAGQGVAIVEKLALLKG